MKWPNQDRTRVFLAAAALICAAAVFVILFSIYIQRFDRTLTEENRSRLEEVSGHVAAYLERAIKQQWKELRIVAEASAAFPDQEERVAYLGSMAEELDFAYIGLADEDGFLHAAAFREPKDISKENYFWAAREGESYMTGLQHQIFWDRAVTGIILSIPAPEGTGTAVVAMLGRTELGADVQVESFHGDGFTYIIDAEGYQVLHAKSMAYNNLFQALRNLKFEDGYSLDAMQTDIAAKRAGMTAYSDLGVEKYAYYRPLSFNDWTVVSIVPKGVVTARTSALFRELVLMCVVAVLVFLVLLSTVGILLLRLESRRRANRAKSDFLANMSHDMRTPMNAIIGMTTIANLHANEPDTIRDCMKKIGFSSNHLLELINDVLDMSRIESGKMTLNQEPFSLAEVLEGVVDMVYPRIDAKGQHFFFLVHGIKHENFEGDSLRLSQVLVNILTNAMKFTPEGGRITVEIEELSGESDTVLFRFVFTDTGIGMKQEFLKDLFTPFTRERSSRVDKTEGSGLGMSITKQIVELMNGRIEVKSAEGKGTTFTVTLPLMLDSDAPKEPAPPNWRVLLVGDSEDQGAEAVRSLESFGLFAVWTADMKSAAQCLREDEYQAVFLDRQAYVPEGVNPLLTGNVHKPALILSAYDWEDIREEAMQVGVRDFVQKPLLRTTLCRALRKAAGMEADESLSTISDIDLTRKHILLAEDNLLNQEIVQAALQETGVSTVWACDGAECVALFEASPVGSLDLILMDIQMPNMNGYEAAKRIRALDRPDARIPILAMSANAYNEDIAAAMEAGMNGYLTKPIDIMIWMTEIKKHLLV